MGQTEEFQVKGEELMETVKEWIREGSIRRITVRDGNDRTLLDIPLTIGVVGALFAPFAVAIGMVAALATDCTVTVIRDEDAESEDAETEDAEPDDAESEDSGAE